MRIAKAVDFNKISPVYPEEVEVKNDTAPGRKFEFDNEFQNAGIEFDTDLKDLSKAINILIADPSMPGKTPWALCSCNGPHHAHIVAKFSSLIASEMLEHPQMKDKIDGWLNSMIPEAKEFLEKDNYKNFKKIIELMALFHDSARPSNGIDQWDEVNAINVNHNIEYLLKTTGLSEEARAQIMTYVKSGIEGKDKRVASSNGSDFIFGAALGAGDALHTGHAFRGGAWGTDPFDKTRVRLYREHPEFQATFDKIANEVARFVPKPTENKLDSVMHYFQNSSLVRTNHNAPVQLKDNFAEMIEEELQKLDKGEYPIMHQHFSAKKPETPTLGGTAAAQTTPFSQSSAVAAAAANPANNTSTTESIPVEIFQGEEPNQTKYQVTLEPLRRVSHKTINNPQPTDTYLLTATIMGKKPDGAPTQFKKHIAFKFYNNGAVAYDLHEYNENGELVKETQLFPSLSAPDSIERKLLKAYRENPSLAKDVINKNIRHAQTISDFARSTSHSEIGTSADQPSRLNPPIEIGRQINYELAQRLVPARDQAGQLIEKPSDLILVKKIEFLDGGAIKITGGPDYDLKQHHNISITLFPNNETPTIGVSQKGNSNKITVMNAYEINPHMHDPKLTTAYNLYVESDLILQRLAHQILERHPAYQETLNNHKTIIAENRKHSPAARQTTQIEKSIILHSPYELAQRFDETGMPKPQNVATKVEKIKGGAIRITGLYGSTGQQEQIVITPGNPPKFGVYDANNPYKPILRDADKIYEAYQDGKIGTLAYELYLESDLILNMLNLQESPLQSNSTSRHTPHSEILAPDGHKDIIRQRRKADEHAYAAEIPLDFKTSTVDDRGNIKIEATIKNLPPQEQPSLNIYPNVKMNPELLPDSRHPSTGFGFHFGNRLTELSIIYFISNDGKAIFSRKNSNGSKWEEIKPEQLPREIAQIITDPEIFERLKEKANKEAQKHIACPQATQHQDPNIGHTDGGLFDRNARRSSQANQASSANDNPNNVQRDSPAPGRGPNNNE